MSRKGGEAEESVGVVDPKCVEIKPNGGKIRYIHIIFVIIRDGIGWR